LADWLRKHLMPNYIDPEDIDIFRIVDDPKEVVRLVKQGVKKHWWKPLDEDLVHMTDPSLASNKGPLSGDKTAETGEGTRYGKRPKKAQQKHAKPSRKPVQ
jgi:hypothetical protein